MTDQMSDSHPSVPLTLEGSSVLHQFFRFDWKAWRGYAPSERGRMIAEAIATLKTLEQKDESGPARSALYSQLGHKGDLMLIHFRDSLEELNQVELTLAQTPLYDFLELRHSYVSVVELGLYESCAQDIRGRDGQGIRAVFSGMECGDCFVARARC